MSLNDDFGPAEILLFKYFDQVVLTGHAGLLLVSEAIVQGGWKLCILE